MDRSFLFDAGVVEASRDFVCIRLTTYEDESEAEFLKNIYVGKSGGLENTTFAILAADGKTKLTKTGRAPFHEYRNGSAMAAGMKRIAKTKNVSPTIMYTDTQIPFSKNLEIGLNVAASDGLPLVVIVADDQTKLDAIAKRMLPAVWNENVAGQFVFASVLGSTKATGDSAKGPAVASDPLKSISGLMINSETKIWNGVLVIQPDQFGVSGKVLVELDAATSSETMREKFQAVIKTYPRPAHNHQAHIQLGIELGLEWESKLPESDPESVRARERIRGK